MKNEEVALPLHLLCESELLPKLLHGKNKPQKFSQQLPKNLSQHLFDVFTTQLEYLTRFVVAGTTNFLTSARTEDTTDPRHKKVRCLQYHLFHGWTVNWFMSGGRAIQYLQRVGVIWLLWKILSWTWRKSLRGHVPWFPRHSHDPFGVRRIIAFLVRSHLVQP